MFIVILVTEPAQHLCGNHVLGGSVMPKIKPWTGIENGSRGPTYPRKSAVTLRVVSNLNLHRILFHLATRFCTNTDKKGDQRTNESLRTGRRRSVILVQQRIGPYIPGLIMPLSEPC